MFGIDRMDDGPDIIEVMYQDGNDASDILSKANEISLRTNVDSAMRKTLILASASYFEFRVRNCLEEYVAERTSSDPKIASLIRIKALERQYHTYFDWDKNNANKFFSLFGDEFKQKMIARISSSPETEKSVRAFMEMGRLRNLLVHENFATYPLEKTSSEIMDLYRLAGDFLEMLPFVLREEG